MPEPALSDRLAAIRGVIADRQRAGGWSHPVRIVAVTKTHGPEAVRAAVTAGLDAVGENRVQEALPKMDATADLVVEWHLIGGLQRNKARQAVGKFALIHSVDRAELAAELDRRAEPVAIQPVLVQVNCSAEPQKGGVEPGELAALLDQMRTMPRLRVDGLMTMAEFTDDEAVQRRTFALLRTLRDQMQAEGHALPELSMGMSGDYPAAIEEGATMLRLGSILFGPRPQP
ncbi:MAG TPA: YggS family pyridoxal phosphate-dependent enzyme [Gemmatimonadales bacterium]|nr:YggS family pyridoxal phosphate-dependent enzyme [Gemmatimonadales bacterium]